MKRTILFSFLLLALVFAFAYGAYEYKKHPAAPTTVSIQKYNHAVDVATQAKRDYAIEAAKNTQAQAQIQAIVTQRNTLCTTYKTAKPALNPALCQ